MSEKKISLAVVVHVGNENVWGQMEKYITILEKSEVRKDYYFFIVQDLVKKEFTKELEIKYPQAIVENIKNKGMDCGSFFLFVNKALKNNKEYDYVLKLHTKTRADWRNELVSPLFLNGNLEKNLKMMELQKSIGMIGARKWTLGSLHHLENKKWAQIYINRIYDSKSTPDIQRKQFFGTGLNLLPKYRFIGGTIFIVRFSVLKNTLSKVDLQSWFDEQQPGRAHIGKAHALERVFGMLVGLENQIVVGV